MTKNQKNMFNSYYNAYMKGVKTELWEVYGHFSRNKQKALDYCKELQYRLGGYSGTIVNANCHFFTYAFLYWDADTMKECLCYCTHANDYKFAID